MRFDLPQERCQRGDVLVAQRGGAVRAVVGEAPQELLAAGFVNDVLVGIDHAADQGLAKAARRVDDELVVRAGERIDGKGDALTRPREPSAG